MRDRNSMMRRDRNLKLIHLKKKYYKFEIDFDFDFEIGFGFDSKGETW